MKIKISKIILSITLLSSLLLSLTSCDEKEEHKIIQYQEEVKLSDGSMIWVDIKRHYGWSGYAPGMGKGAYLPGAVEISWDTGFEGVGRRSVFFDNGVIFIDKIDNTWYVLGGRPSYSGSYKGINAVNCRDVGESINNGLTCVYVLSNAKVSRQSTDVEKFVQPIIVNILTLDGLYDWEHNSGKLANSQLSWFDKLNLNASIGNIDKQSLGKPYSQY